jgi:hypothetical protein
MRPITWIVFGVLACGCARKPAELRFDTAGWQAGTSYVGETPTVRQKMASDVVNRVLPGKTKLEIEHMLGPSPKNSYLRVSEGMDLIYLLGPEQSGLFAVDSEWLLIWLDPSDRFKGAAIKRD